MVRTFSPYTHTENGTTSFELAEYFGEVQMDEKSELMLKRVRFHTVTQQRTDEFMPLYLQSAIDNYNFFQVSGKKTTSRIR